KPANIIVGDHARVKVLDFGLARLGECPQLSPDDATMTARIVTEEGMIAGTAPYMSPEQAEGKKLDARSDIFSFGAVLYEMVTGRRAFQGGSRLSTLTAILREEPKPAGQVVGGLPCELERIIARCLRKDPERRFQTTSDLKVALEELKEESNLGTSGVVNRRRHHLRGLVWVIALTAVCVGGVFWFVRPPVKPSE